LIEGMAPENSFDLIPLCSSETADGTFNLEDVIACFADDDSCVSHALPASLTKDQRQLAKKLVGCYQNVVCESYGFGLERQLHLFKKRAGGNRVQTRVKNTFIDAWLENSQGKNASTPMFRSLPSDWRGSSDVASAPEVAKQCNAVMVRRGLPVSMQLGETLEDSSCSTHDIEPVCSICSTPSPCTTPMAMLGVPSVPEACDPCGTELTASKENVEPSYQNTRLTALPPPTSPSNVAMLPAGTEVEIDGLVARPDFNGLSGIVRSWDPVLRRYEVLLNKIPVGHGSRLVKAKRGNLKLTPPPPPHSAAAVAVIELDRCLPLGPEENFQQNGVALVIDASPCTQDSAGWSQWPLCDPSMSPNAETNMHTAEFFGTSDASWEYSMSLHDTVSNYDASDGTAWLRSPLHDTDGWGTGMAR
jgi:hypothetical protein